MPEYLHPGVYIEEIERGPKPIEGVPTSTAAFLGETERGPIKPRLVTSYKEFKRWFGGVFGPDKFLPYAVNGFFENGGKRLYVCRLVGASATPAQAPFGNFIVRAVGAGLWGTRIWAAIDDSTTKQNVGGTPQPVGFRLRLAYWSKTPASFRAFDPFVREDQLPRPTAIEVFDDLVTDPASPDYWEKRLLDNSAYAMLERTPGAPADARPPNESRALTGGTDQTGALGAPDYEGEPLDSASAAVDGHDTSSHAETRVP